MPWTRPLFVALLLLTLSLTADALFSHTGCENSKMCWVDSECLTKPPPAQAYILSDYWNAADLSNKDIYSFLKPDCTKYLVVEPSVDHFIYEMMSSAVREEEELVLQYQSVKARADSFFEKMYFKCKNHTTTSGQEKEVYIENEAVTSPHAFCRFKVTVKRRDTSLAFYGQFKGIFDQGAVTITGENGQSVSVVEYNEIHFKSRVPCKYEIFHSAGVIKDEHISEAVQKATIYSCAPQYELMLKLASNFEPAKHVLMCNWGDVRYMDGSVEKMGRLVDKIHSAKCTRHRNTLCQNPCSNCTDPAVYADGKKAMLKCSTQFTVMNRARKTKYDLECSEKSTPDKHLWKNQEIEDYEIKEVQCTDTLSCKDLDYIDFDTENMCDNCTKVELSDSGFSCPDGGSLTLIVRNENNQQRHHQLDTITCNPLTGKWNFSGYTHDPKTTKLGCIGKRNKKNNDRIATGALGGPWQYIGYGLGGLLLMLLIILLLWCIFCRKRKQKEDPKQEPSMVPIVTTSTKMDSSATEIPVPPPTGPISPDSDTPAGGAAYSGKRVQMINCSKERLLEIEPNDADPSGAEFSARDKTNSDKSQQTGTVDGVSTITGRQSAPTEQTNEKSRTVERNEEGSDASRGGGKHKTKTINSTVGDSSETGPGDVAGTTRTTAAAKGKEKETKKKDGPRVEFRERVSYETDTHSRQDQSDQTMHTAPEQQLKDQSSNTGEKENKIKKKGQMQMDDPSKGSATKEQTRTTQNTRENTKDEPSKKNKAQDDSAAANRSRSRNTDMSRTG